MVLDGRPCIEPSCPKFFLMWLLIELAGSTGIVAGEGTGFLGLRKTGQGQAVFSPAVFCHPTWLWPDFFRESSMWFKLQAALSQPNLNRRSNWFNTNYSNKRGWTGDKKTKKIFTCTSAKISKIKVLLPYQASILAAYGMFYERFPAISYFHNPSTVSRLRHLSREPHIYRSYLHHRPFYRELQASAALAETSKFSFSFACLAS